MLDRKRAEPLPRGVEYGLPTLSKAPEDGEHFRREIVDTRHVLQLLGDSLRLSAPHYLVCRPANSHAKSL